MPFVTLNEGGWDHHEKIFDGLDKKLPPFEAAIAALIDDLDERGLLETTLVVALGEFGRTPKINKRGGRDHWSNAMSVLFAGCGTPGGQVVGATDARGYTAVERILSPENFAATVYTKLGIDPGKILYAPNGRPVHLVSDPTPDPRADGVSGHRMGLARIVAVAAVVLSFGTPAPPSRRRSTASSRPAASAARRSP